MQCYNRARESHPAQVLTRGREIDSPFDQNRPNSDLNRWFCNPGVGNLDEYSCPDTSAHSWIGTHLLKWALSFLLLIGVTLIADGVGQHISKGYVYFRDGIRCCSWRCSICGAGSCRLRTEQISITWVIIVCSANDED
jgi:hypothetical protein